jgi:hypothetical protein
METIEVITVQATCQVEGCENFGHVIELVMVPSAVIVCGPCATTITDVVTV